MINLIFYVLFWLKNRRAIFLWRVDLNESIFRRNSSRCRKRIDSESTTIRKPRNKHVMTDWYFWKFIFMRVSTNYLWILDVWVTFLERKSLLKNIFWFFSFFDNKNFITIINFAGVSSFFPRLSFHCQNIIILRFWNNFIIIKKWMWRFNRRMWTGFVGHFWW